MEEFPGRDYFDIGPRQKFITTPHAIARIHKTTALEYSITLDASTSADLDERKLTYKWTVLRGDNKRIKIELYRQKRIQSQNQRSLARADSCTKREQTIATV